MESAFQKPDMMQKSQMTQNYFKSNLTNRRWMGFSPPAGTDFRHRLITGRRRKLRPTASRLVDRDTSIDYLRSTARSLLDSTCVPFQALCDLCHLENRLHRLAPLSGILFCLHHNAHSPRV